jgi:formylglycine-generating enzyme required for sulfatase activity
MTTGSRPRCHRYVTSSTRVQLIEKEPFFRQTLATLSPARKRFLREARSSAQVRHENVVQIYEVGEQPLPYLAMEFIPGETLQQRLDRCGPLDVSEVLRIGRQIAEGLVAAHACELIHRDIKPSNVLLEGGSHKAKITDFGLARAADDASISQSGIIAGTPMFMAPEQALGRKIDQRADLFSFGSVLYQMASGRPPFRAPTTLAVLKRVTEETPRPIAEIIPETPDWLCGIITKLHAKDPDERFQSAREVADVLADCEAKLKAKQEVKNVLPVAAKPAGRKWAVAAAVLLLPVIALAVTELAGVTHLLRKQPPIVAVPPTGHPQAEPKAPLTTGSFALAFDGKNSVVRIQSLKIQEHHALTVETWVVLERPIDESKVVSEDLLGNPDRAGFSLCVPPPHNAPSGYPEKRLGFLVFLDRAGKYAGAYTKQPPPRNRLIHLAGVYDGKSEIRLYVNGELQSRTPAEGIRISNLSLTLGGNSHGSSRFLGRMDEVRISRVARYDADFAPAKRYEPDGDTLALYHFDEGKGSILKDSSGNEHHGEIVGAKWVKADGSALPVVAMQEPPPAAIAPFDAIQARAHQEAWAKYLGVPVEKEVILGNNKEGNAVKLTMILIPPGEFLMGSTDEERASFLQVAQDANDPWAINRIPAEGPRHRVRITKPFWLGRHEVTIGQFRQFVQATKYRTDAEQDGQGGGGVLDGRMIEGPQFVWNGELGYVQTDSHPVVNLTWKDAIAFGQWLSQTHNTWKFFLPTEAQREYACRAGTTTYWHCGDSEAALLEYAWFKENSANQTHPVGQLRPNAWGLYDMHGNVWEWCAELYAANYYATSPVDDPTGPQAGSYHTHRGGGWNDFAGNCRSANRADVKSTWRHCFYGIRVAATLELPD